MPGSDLKEVLSTVHADKTCDQILSGHYYSRAERPQSLVLSKLIFEEFQNGVKDSPLFYSSNYTAIEIFIELIYIFLTVRKHVNCGFSNISKLHREWKIGIYICKLLS